MTRTSRLTGWLSALGAAGLLSAPAVRAITYGFVDDDRAFPNVGAFIVQRASDGAIFPICSGTLISPTVFLTAAHCTAFYTQDLAPLGFTALVSFDSPIGFGALTDLKRTKLIPAVQVVTNPAFNQAQSDSGDIGVLVLPQRATRGIPPAALPPRGLLDELSAQNGLHDAVFTAVGYGLQNRVTGGGPPFFEDANPIPRMFAFSGFHSLNPGYLRLSQNPSTGDGGTCFGDSGGPNFLEVDGRRVLAATTVTGDAVCRATNVDYRLDTDSARGFLGSFVRLP
jgi:hypothetical protein